MITVAEHSFDETLISVGSAILDIGCRGFEFTNFFRSRGCKVLAIDCDLLIGDYVQCAVVGDSSIQRYIQYSNDPQGTKVVTTPNNTPVESVTIQQLGYFDLIKMDCEGSEYEIIMSLTEAPAKQISVEFHLHTGIYTGKEIKEMEDRLLVLGYFPMKHDMSHQHGAGLNYWDSLFVMNKPIVLA